MPNSRAKDKTMVAVWLEPGILAALDEGRYILHLSRSDFLREALGEYLTVKMGIPFPQEQKRAPDRVRSDAPANPALNETPGSKTPDAVEAAALAIASAAGELARRRYPKARGPGGAKPSRSGAAGKGKAGQ